MTESADRRVQHNYSTFLGFLWLEHDVVTWSTSAPVGRFYIRSGSRGSRYLEMSHYYSQTPPPLMHPVPTHPVSLPEPPGTPGYVHSSSSSCCHSKMCGQVTRRLSAFYFFPTLPECASSASTRLRTELYAGLSLSATAAGTITTSRPHGTDGWTT